MRHKGKIAEWRDDQGFGFVVPSGGGERVFVHISAFGRDARRPVAGELITYELSFDDRRRPRAAKARRSSERARQKPYAHPTHAHPKGGSRSNLPVILAMGFVIALGAFTGAGKVPPPMLWIYLAASAIAFIAYWLDKAAARAGRWRTKEATLHLLALGGGWPGALVAQRLLRHKSSKTEFQWMFWLTVVINCAALGVLLKSFHK